MLSDALMCTVTQIDQCGGLRSKRDAPRLLRCVMSLWYLARRCSRASARTAARDRAGLATGVRSRQASVPSRRRRASRYAMASSLQATRGHRRPSVVLLLGHDEHVARHQLGVLEPQGQRRVRASSRCA